MRFARLSPSEPPRGGTPLPQEGVGGGSRDRRPALPKEIRGQAGEQQRLAGIGIDPCGRAGPYGKAQRLGQGAQERTVVDAPPRHPKLRDSGRPKALQGIRHAARDGDHGASEQIGASRPRTGEAQELVEMGLAEGVAARGARPILREKRMPQQPSDPRLLGLPRKSASPVAIARCVEQPTS